MSIPKAPKITTSPPSAPAPAVAPSTAPAVELGGMKSEEVAARVRNARKGIGSLRLSEAEAGKRGTAASTNTTSSYLLDNPGYAPVGNLAGDKTSPTKADAPPPTATVPTKRDSGADRAAEAKIAKNLSGGNGPSGLKIGTGKRLINNAPSATVYRNGKLVSGSTSTASSKKEHNRGSALSRFDR